jgi:hypothetical protein
MKKQLSELANLSNELESMNEALSKKNMEILELKNILFENEKMQVDNANLRREI